MNTSSTCPPPVRELIGLLSHVVARSRQLRDVWGRLDRLRQSYPDYSGWLEPDDDTTPEEYKGRRRSYARLKPRQRDMAEALDDVVRAVRRWRAAIDAAREAIPGVAQWTDDPSRPAIEAWTATLDGALRALGGYVNRMTEGDVPLQPLSDGFGKSVGEVQNRLNQLKSIRNTPRDDQSTISAQPVDRRGAKPGVTDAEEPPVDLVRAERDCPSLDTQNGEWVRSDMAAKLEGIEPSTLADYRNRQDWGARITADRRFGLDCHGRRWRRRGTDRTRPWYLKQDLLSVKR